MHCVLVPPPPPNKINKKNKKYKNKTKKTQWIHVVCTIKKSEFCKRFTIKCLQVTLYQMFFAPKVIGYRSFLPLLPYEFMSASSNTRQTCLSGHLSIKAHTKTWRNLIHTLKYCYDHPPLPKILQKGLLNL